LELVTVDGEVGWLGRSRARREPRWPTRGQPQRFIGRLTAESRFSTRAKPAIEESADLILNRFPTTRKNSSGYALDEFVESGDLLDLIIGSEGTLGFVTRIELALDAIPGAVSCLLLSIEDLESLSDIVQSLLALEPTAVELLDRSFFRCAGVPQGLSLDSTEAVLLVEFERDREQAARAVVADAITATKGSCGHVQTAFTEPERKELWAIRSAATPSLAYLPRNPRSLQIVGDGCVPVESLGTYLRGVRAAAREAGIETVVFGHAGDGHLHVNALVDTGVADFRERLERLLESVTALVVQLGGTPSGEHGDGRLRAPVLERIYGPDIVALFRLVKAAFDPTGLLNPGVILPGKGAASVADLKVGESAAPIPEEMAAGLHEIERHGRWGTPKLEIASRANSPLARTP
jgi:FAD/FMN-containing dehydrogenase